MLVEYIFRIPSERMLVKEIQIILAYRFFLGYNLDEEIPHHSVSNMARRRFDLEVFSHFFSKIVSLCQEAGLIRQDDIYVNATIIHANVNLKSFVENKASPVEHFR